jgi:hypothetical protein
VTTPVGGEKIYTIATDYANYELVRIAGGTATELRSYTTSMGMALNASGGSFFALNQGNGVIDVMDSNGVIANYGISGTTANPYQVLKQGDTLYVLRWADNSIAMIKADCGDTIGSIDLSSLVNSQGNTNATSAVLYGNTMYVALERTLDGATAYDTGKIAVIDLGTRKVTSAISLVKTNPQQLVANGSDLYVVSHGTYATDTTGGIERIDMATSTWKAVVYHAPATAKPSNMVVTGTSQAWVVLDNGYPTSTVAPFSLSTGTLGSAATSVSEVNAVAFDGTDLIVADRTGTGAIWTLDASTGAAIASVATPLPPSGLVVMP